MWRANDNCYLDREMARVYYTVQTADGHANEASCHVFAYHSIFAGRVSRNIKTLQGHGGPGCLKTGHINAKGLSPERAAVCKQFCV